MSIVVSPKQLFRFLIVCIVTLVGLHILAVGAAISFPGAGLQGVRAAFDLDQERNLPSKFSALQLLLAVTLLFFLYVEGRRSGSRDRRFWLALAGVFLYLAVDEYAQIHERLTTPVISWFGERNVPIRAWLIPYAILVAAFGASFVRFWWRQPRATRWQLAVAASVYIGGGMGLELVGSWLAETVGEASPLYLLEVVVEESMEMIGVALFIRALATILQSRAGAVTVQLGSRVLEDHRELLHDIETADRRKRERRAG